MKKLYPVTLTFDSKTCPGTVEAVALRGEFLFYESGLTGHTDETGMVDCDRRFTPSEYREGLDSIGGFCYWDMEKNEDGYYSVSLSLPAGAYLYHFVVNPELSEPTEDPRLRWSNMYLPDGTLRGFRNLEQCLKSGFRGEKNRILTDPANPPAVPTVSGTQLNSVLYVGTEEDNFCMPVSDRSKAGTVTYLSYPDVDGAVRSMAVYLPAGFDRDREYPLILVSHGGGGNEADWMHQGSIANIMDRLIADGSTREAILVCMNNAVYDWDYAKIARNCEETIIPFLQKLFRISPRTCDRAFCGLSMGSMTTLYMYMHRSHSYDYYGAFSGGMAPGHACFTLEDPHLKDVKLMIGTAEEDIAYNEREIGVPPTIRALKAKGLPYTPYFTTGSHDWFCWPQMFRHFAAEILWK